jgi:hypothetical protein
MIQMFMYEYSIIYLKISISESQLGIIKTLAMPTCERPWHGHRKITKRIGQSLSKSNAPNNVILHSTECITLACQCWEQFNVLLL